jgi:hypothetical protein
LGPLRQVFGVPTVAAVNKRILKLILEASTTDGHWAVLHLREHSSQPGSFSWALQALAATLSELVLELQLRCRLNLYITNGYRVFYRLVIKDGVVQLEEGRAIDQPLPVRSVLLTLNVHV